MVKICNNKTQNSIFLENKEKRPHMRCHFKLQNPAIFSSENLSSAIQQLKNEKEKHNGLSRFQSTQIQPCKGKFRFFCNVESHKKRNELKRKKILQKIQRNYNINMEDLNENIKSEIIVKVRIMEKEKKETEKKNMERTLNIISALLEEQKRKQKVKNIKKLDCTWRRTLKVDSLSKVSWNSVAHEEGSRDFEEETPVELLKETCKEKGVNETKIHLPIESEKIVTENETIKKGNEAKNSPENLEESESLFTNTFSCGTISKQSNVIPVEKSLKCAPDRIIFQDYKEGEVYIQDLKITNLSFETVHCRYLGIGVYGKSEKRFPVGVAVRDNVKLRPGLSCSTKVRFFCEDASKELECSVVYETRRENKPSKHSWFFVPVLCTLATAKIKIKPLKLLFPSLTWNLAVSTEGRKLLKKVLKIENSGGKACFCKITRKHNEGEKIEKYEASGEISQTLSSTNTKIISKHSVLSSVSHTEFLGEENLRPIGEEITEILLNELLDNVFAHFCFSEKYCIQIPPFSTKEIEVTFIPEYQGFHHEIVLVQCEGSQNSQQEAVEMMGDIKKLPLKVEPEVIDLKICLANSDACMGTFKVYNKSKGPYSVKLKIPHSIKEHAHVYPKVATIQPLSCRQFSVRIHPRNTIFQNSSEYYNEDLTLLEFPVSVHPVNNGICLFDHIKIVVFALITENALELTPSEVDFGTVSTLETIQTQIQLINHSLVVQEFGFLNLPKGVRVEPNLGFGKILPKESITLNLLYSPEPELIDEKEREMTHIFDVRVTSIAENGGFREKLESTEESMKFSECDDYESKSVAPEYDSNFDGEVRSNDGNQRSSCSGECLEDMCSIEGEQLITKIQQQEIKVREFLKKELDKSSELSFIKRQSLQEQVKNSSLLSCEKLSDSISSKSQYKDQGEDYWEKKPSLHSKLNVIKCKACVFKPYFQVSKTVIQLPATPCSSYSFYRFRITAGNKRNDLNCTCKPETEKYSGLELIGRFEFQCDCPQIRFEPQSGYLKGTDGISVTIIFKPEFTIEMLQEESRIQKGNKIIAEKKLEPRNSLTSKSSTSAKSKLKKKQVSSQKRKSINDEEFNASSIFQEIENLDLFSGEKSLLKLMNPFLFKANVQCLIEIQEGKKEKLKVENHHIILICPVIKPDFVYLGNSHEINFGKVSVGTKSRIFLEVQNISIKRISPTISLLDPCGSFFCPAGLREVNIDSEHVWSQPLTFAPLEAKGIEKEFFTINYGPTIIFLTVSGEGVESSLKTHSNYDIFERNRKSSVEINTKSGNQTPTKSRFAIGHV